MNVWIRRTLQTGLLVAGIVALAPAAHAQASTVTLTDLPVQTASGSTGTIQHIPATGSVIVGKASRKKLRLISVAAANGDAGTGPDDETMTTDGAGWQLASADGAGWQLASADGAGWQLASADGAGWQVHELRAA